MILICVNRVVEKVPIKGSTLKDFFPYFNITFFVMSFFPDRTISVDWAVPKTKFEKVKKGTEGKKDESKKDKNKDEDSDEEDDGSDDDCEIMDENDDVKPDLR